MARGQRSNDAELARAARNLIIAHGGRAAGVAEIRARRLDECGEDEVAQTWRQIGTFVRSIEAGENPCARSRRASRAQPAVVPPADAVPAGRPAAIMQAVHPRPVHNPVFHVSAGDMPTKEYRADLIRESADLQRWAGATPSETATSIGSAAAK